MPSMRVVRISRGGGSFELAEQEIPQPQKDQVRIRVEACGICHSDIFVKEGLFPGIEYPRVPGHEAVGTIDKVGDGVRVWREGQRIGIGWHGGHCFVCEPCRRGDFINCQNGRITGLTHDGGYAEYTIASQEALVLVPESLSSIEAAPLLCAGVTTYNALRNSGARGGDLVAVQGIGGLGHLGVQFAHKLGLKTVAVSRGKDKEQLALNLGADIYIDSETEDVSKQLASLGGAHVALATAPNSKAISGLIDGLGIGGRLVVVGASAEPIEVTPLQLIGGRKSIQGWPSGHAKDTEETLNFSAFAGIRPKIETFPLEKAADAYERMITNRARFRVVLDISR